MATAFAVYSADDNSFNFYKRDTVPTAGSSFNGKTATAVYTGIETDVYNWNTLPWYSNHSSIASASIVDSGIAPVSTAYWFYQMNNASLTTISGLDKLDTTNVTTMSGMFRDCSSLTSLDVSYFNTANVTNMSFMFYGCSKLTSLDVSGWNTANVTSMYSMFSSCSALITLDLVNFDTSNVTNMGYMFSGCKALTTIYAGDGWSTTKVTSSDSMFSNCSKLPNFSSSYTDKTNAHYNSGGYLIKFDKVYYAWNGLGTNAADYTCKAYRFVNNNGTIDKQSINSTTIIRNSYTADSVTLTATFNDDWAIAQTKTFTNSGFAVYSADDNSLNFYKRIGALTAGSTLDDRIATAVYTGIETDKYSSNSTVPWADYTSSIASVSIVDSGIAPVSTAYWFYRMNNASLTTISGLDKLDTTNVTDMCGMFYNCSALTSLDVSSFDTSKVTIMDNMFYACKALTSLDVSSFNTANVTNMYSMFSGCWTLTTLDLSGFDTGNVTSMGYMFSHCIALTTLDLSSFDTSKVMDMCGMFYDCPKLTSLDVSGWNTVNVTNMYIMFNGCSALTTLDLSSFDTSNVTSMARMFMNCAKLTSITGLNNWNTSKVTTMESMFQGTALTTLDLSSFDTSNVTSMNYMFSGYNSSTKTTNSALTNITGLSNWNTFKVTTMKEMFYGCSVLTSLDISEWNTANVKNMYNMFRICSSLTTLDLSSFDTSNVTNMGNMFSSCSKLTIIYAGDGWSTANVPSNGSMFYNCSKLPNFNSSYIDKTKAHYNSGGYLTYKQYIPKIVFIANSGLFQSDSSTTKSVQTNLNGTTSLSALVEFPTKSGYVFRGWSISSTGVVTYTPYATPTISNATWLYAVWQKAENYLVREDTLVNIANAVRSKTGGTDVIALNEMATTITALGPTISANGDTLTITN